MSADDTVRSVNVGSYPVVFVDVEDSFGVPATPSAGSLFIQKPSATEATLVPWESLVAEPDRGEGPIVGRVEYTFPDAVDEAGRWELWWSFSEGVLGSAPFWFRASAPNVTLPA